MRDKIQKMYGALAILLMVIFVYSLFNLRLSILRDMPNVVVTPHMAFYTDRSVSDMVKNSMLSCLYEDRGEKDPWKVV